MTWAEAAANVTCPIATAGHESRAERDDGFYHACEQSETAVLELATAPPPALGLPPGNDYAWILGQFALSTALTS
jgi:hypothetical protein